MATAELAIYDLDRTITRAGTYTPFLLFWARRKASWRLFLMPVVLAFIGVYGVKIISRKRLKEIMQWLLMGGVTKKTTLIPVVNAFARRIVRQGVYPKAVESIIADRAAGRRVIVATAAHEFYVRPIAQMLNINDVVATRSYTDEYGDIMARIQGENCYGSQKLLMLESYLNQIGIERNRARIRFYSDHISDLPVLGWSDDPIIVNASSRLKAIAAKRGWTIQDW